MFVTIFASLRGVGIDNSKVGANDDEVVTVAVADLPQSDAVDELDYIPQFSTIPTLDRPDIHGFLSRVEYNNNVAYLLGSMHAGRANWFPLNPIVEEAMARSAVFAFETDLEFFLALDDDLDNMPASIFLEALVIIAMEDELSMLPYDITLEDVLSPNVFENLIEMLETYKHVTYGDIYFLTPEPAFGTIINTEFNSYISIYDEYSVDLYVLDFALTHDKPTIGLNDVFYETLLMFTIPIEVQAGLFEGFQDRDTALNEYIEAFNALIEAYETQDAERIHYIEFGNLQDYSNIPFVYYRHEVFAYRTSIYANEILRLLRETEEPTTFFVTVGAAHIIYGYIFRTLEANGIEIVELWR